MPKEDGGKKKKKAKEPKKKDKASKKKNASDDRQKKKGKKSKRKDPSDLTGDSDNGPKKRYLKYEKPLGRSRVYYDVNDGYPYPPEKYDISRVELKWGKYKNYKVYWEKKLGEGAFGEVYLAKDRRTGEEVCVKTIKPDKEVVEMIQNEVKMLQYLKDGYHTIHMLDTIKDPKRNLKMIVFEYVHNPDYKDIFDHFTDLDARSYLYELLLALEYTHSKGIIHRDVKGRNVLYDPELRKLRLIDWGFGTFYVRGRRIKKWPGTRPYRSPEMFLHYELYDYSVDIWAFGCVLGGIVFQRSPLFYSKNYTDKERANVAQMASIVRWLGTDDYETFWEKYNFKHRKSNLKYGVDKLEAEAKLRRHRLSWSRLIDKRNAHLATPEALDLLDKLLVYDHEKRLTAAEALQHEYFNPIREDIDARLREHEDDLKDRKREEATRMHRSTNANGAANAKGDMSTFSSSSPASSDTSSSFSEFPSKRKGARRKEHHRPLLSGSSTSRERSEFSSFSDATPSFTGESSSEVSLGRGGKQYASKRAIDPRLERLRLGGDFAGGRDGRDARDDDARDGRGGALDSARETRRASFGGGGTLARTGGRGEARRTLGTSGRMRQSVGGMSPRNPPPAPYLDSPRDRGRDRALAPYLDSPRDRGGRDYRDEGLGGTRRTRYGSARAAPARRTMSGWREERASVGGGGGYRGSLNDPQYGGRERYGGRMSLAAYDRGYA